MKKISSIALSVLFAALLFYSVMHLVVAPHNARKSAFVGETESFNQIEKIVSDAEFSMNQLKQYIRAKEYIESQRRQTTAFLISLAYATFFVAVYCFGRSTTKRILRVDDETETTP